VDCFPYEFLRRFSCVDGWYFYKEVSRLECSSPSSELDYFCYCHVKLSENLIYKFNGWLKVLSGLLI